MKVLTWVICNLETFYFGLFSILFLSKATSRINAIQVSFQCSHYGEFVEYEGCFVFSAVPTFVSEHAPFSFHSSQKLTIRLMSSGGQKSPFFGGICKVAGISVSYFLCSSIELFRLVNAISIFKTFVRF